jgi:hypothetical protein
VPSTIVHQNIQIAIFHGANFSRIATEVHSSRAAGATFVVTLPFNQIEVATR